MKKIFLAVIICLILTGCSAKEKTIVNPNGTSKTYQFLSSIKYNENSYTLKLKNQDQTMTIVWLKDKVYYQIKDQANTLITIEKNNKKYTLNQINKTYTKQDITSYDNYAKGYLPKNTESIKNQSYKTAVKWEGINRYVYEKYTYDEGEIIYYFKGNKLKKITNKTPLTETTVNFISLSNKTDEAKFKLPKSYQEITY